MIRSLAWIAIFVPALLLAGRIGAQAAPTPFCQDYAQAAINQVRAAQAVPACAQGARGPRWTTVEDIHFRWCLTQPIPAVEAERGARTGYLRACRGY